MGRKNKKVKMKNKICFSRIQLECIAHRHNRICILNRPYNLTVVCLRKKKL